MIASPVCNLYCVYRSTLATFTAVTRWVALTAIRDAMAGFV